MVRTKQQATSTSYSALGNSSRGPGFPRDLLTEGEINEFGKRLQVAQMLVEKVSYSQIEKETGLSSTTVARVSKWLNDGMGGYKSILPKMEHHHLSSEMKKGLSSS